jgi:hypothetical protein
VTTILDLPNTDVRNLSNSVRTMFTDANTQQIIPVGTSDSLIVTGFGSQVAAVVEMLRLVDEAARRSHERQEAGERPSKERKEAPPEDLPKPGEKPH